MTVDMEDAELVEALNDIEAGLSGWEMNFVDDLYKWLQEHEGLTVKQRAKAEQVWEAKG